MITGPGLELNVPIFNLNNGNVTRSKTEIQQAILQYRSVRQRITLEVEESYSRYISACEVFDLWHSRIVPSLERSLEQAQNAYKTGEVSYLFVLETMRQLVDAKKRKAQSTSALYKTAAQLNFSIGRKKI